MSALSTYEWQSIYESRLSSSGSYLVHEFYVPALGRSVRYDRIQNVNEKPEDCSSQPSGEVSCRIPAR